MQDFEIKPKKAGHVIVMLVVLLLMSITLWALFLKEEAPGLDSGSSIMIFSCIFIIGSICLFMALKTILRNAPVIRINSDGFEYNPSGVSSGFMHWSNVAELKFVQVRTAQGQLPGPIWEQTLAIKFKDPSLYRKQFNPVMRGLMGLNSSMYDADMFFRLSDFGKQAEQVYELMNQYWKESQVVKAKHQLPETKDSF